MGDSGGRAALDEMGRAVARMLAAVADPPAEEPTARRPTIRDTTLVVPDAADLDGRLAAAEGGWADWRRRLLIAVGRTTATP